MADITTNTLKIGDKNLILRDADAQAKLTTHSQKIATLEADTSSLKDDLTAAQVELAKKANTDGYYEEMTVGNAEQLVSTVTNADDTPYNFRTTAGSADVGDRAYVDAIVGGTLNVNQLAYAINADNWYANQSTINFSNGVATFTATAQYGGMLPLGNAHRPVIINEHKYLFLGEIKKTTASADVTFGITFGNVHFLPIKNSANWEVYSAIVASTNTGLAQINCQDNRTSGWDANQARNIMVFDLTATFGTTIADYVYGLETATAGAGVAWLKANAPKIFDGGYIPFNAGTLQSVVGLSEKRNTGFNQWDEVYEAGGINSSGQNETYSGRYRSKNYIPVLPSTTYYHNALMAIYYYDADETFISAIPGGFLSAREFTTPSNAKYMRFMTNSELSNICINLSDPARNGEYEPYEEHVYPLDSSLTIRGIPKLDSSNKLYYDGDEYLSDGTVNRRYGVVDLGTLNWTDQSETTQHSFYSDVISDAKKTALSQEIPNCRCAKYTATNSEDFVKSKPNLSITVSNSGRANINDNGYTDAASFKAAMSGVYLVYELATPTTENAEPYQQKQIIDADGTEEFVSTSVVPVGHETRYPLDIRGRLDKLLSMPTSNGTYTLQATVTDGKVAYSWVSA